MRVSFRLMIFLLFTLSLLACESVGTFQGFRGTHDCGKRLLVAPR